MSFAENLGAGTLGDGFTGLGTPASLDDGPYEITIDVGTGPVSVPEPSMPALGLAALAAMVAVRRRLANSLSGGVQALSRPRVPGSPQSPPPSLRWLPGLCSRSAQRWCRTLTTAFERRIKRGSLFRAKSSASSCFQRSPPDAAASSNSRRARRRLQKAWPTMCTWQPCQPAQRVSTFRSSATRHPRRRSTPMGRCWPSMRRAKRHTSFRLPSAPAASLFCSAR